MVDYFSVGFFLPELNFSIVFFMRSFLVASCFAEMIHITYSFLFVNANVVKNSAAFLFFRNIVFRSGGTVTVFVFTSTYLETFSWYSFEALLCSFGFEFF